MRVIFLVMMALLYFLPAPLMAAGQSLPLLDRRVFERKDFIYGSEIGAWDTEGGRAVHMAACRHKITEAAIHVIRFGVWNTFPDGVNKVADDQAPYRFSKAIDAIRSLGAYPVVKLPPIWDKQCDGGPDAWNLAWLKQIVKTAGNRVQLYEFANEPDNYCKWNAATYSGHWKKVVPELKAYARSLGFEIYIGGPALANSYPAEIGWIKEFLAETKAAYLSSHNRDVIPDFISTHTYLTEKENASLGAMERAVAGWGEFYDGVRLAIDQAFGDVNDEKGNALAPQIKIADSEYNFTINSENILQASPNFTDSYMKEMIQMFREHHLWMANVFTLQSHQGRALDMLSNNCTAKPLYQSFKAISAADSPYK